MDLGYQAQLGRSVIEKKNQGTWRTPKKIACWVTRVRHLSQVAISNGGHPPPAQFTTLSETWVRQCALVVMRFFNPGSTKPRARVGAFKPNPGDRSRSAHVSPGQKCGSSSGLPDTTCNSLAPVPLLLGQTSRQHDRRPLRGRAQSRCVEVTRSRGCMEVTRSRGERAVHGARGAFPFVGHSSNVQRWTMQQSCAFRTSARLAHRESGAPWRARDPHHTAHAPAVRYPIPRLR